MFNVLASILAALTMVSAQAAAELPDTAAVYDNTAAVNVGAYYADEDFDGVCDYFGENCRHLDLDGDGVCDYSGYTCRYTDSDGDGVCDNYEYCQGHHQHYQAECDGAPDYSAHHYGYGQGHHGGRHHW